MSAPSSREPSAERGRKSESEEESKPVEKTPSKSIKSTGSKTEETQAASSVSSTYSQKQPLIKAKTSKKVMAVSESPGPSPAFVSDFSDEDINHFFYRFNEQERKTWNKYIEEWTRIFGYSGFDPCALFAHIQEIYKREQLTDRFLTDMGKLVLTFIRRGSNITKIIDKTDTEGKEELKTLRKLLDIQTPPQRGQKLPKKVVSLPRIAALFPFLSTIVIKASVPELIDELCRAYHLPTWAATPSLLSMFPTHEDFRPLTQIAMMLSFIYNFALAKYLNNQDPSMPGPNVATIWNIIHSSHRTRYMRDNTRVDALWRTGILRKGDDNLVLSYPQVYKNFYLDGVFNHSLPMNNLLRVDRTTHAALLTKLQVKCEFKITDQNFGDYVMSRKAPQYGDPIPQKLAKDEDRLIVAVHLAAKESGLMFDSSFSTA